MTQLPAKGCRVKAYTRRLSLPLTSTSDIDDLFQTGFLEILVM